MSVGQKIFNHVDFLWDDAEADKVAHDEVELLVYRSNLLGSDLRITNFAGGNTSVKNLETDPLSGEEVNILWVKGSGGDIGSMKRDGLASLYVNRLEALKKQYKGIEMEDEMVAKANHCIFNLNKRAPSIDTSLHAFLPYKHIDHLHPDAIIAIAAAKDGEALTKEIFKGQIGWIPWQRPGFDLGLQLEAAVKENPDLRGLILGSHGLFTWGETAFDCYVNSLEIIEQASVFLEENYGKKSPVFGGPKVESLGQEERLQKAAEVIPLLRGLCSSENRMVGHFTDDDRVLEFVNSEDLDKLAPMGTSCPDHFLRTKICPLVLNLDPSKTVESTDLDAAFEDFRKNYQAYYDRCKKANSPAVRDPNPVVILWPQVGMFTFAKNKQTARVSSEFYINAINVMKGAEAISDYQGLPEQEAFDIEYWLLEEAKLQRMPAEKALSRRVALVTGAAGGIGKSTAEKLLSEGACVIMTDSNKELLQKSLTDLQGVAGKDNVTAISFDLRDDSSTSSSIANAMLHFGGVDTVVNSAGLARSSELTETTEEEWDLLHDVMVKGQFLVCREAAKAMKKQGLSGDIINIVSKNALVAGANNAAYGSAKAAQLHMSRLLAAELGKDKIRVNVVNPDAVIRGSNIWEDGWAAARAEAYGIPVEELPAHYAKRTLLNEEILPEDIAKAVYAYLALLKKSTGNVINVDGGVSGAFVR